MAERTDITVNYELSPRIITVSASSDVVVLQDVVDTLRVSEAEITNLDNNKLISAAGKEDLGGGVSVGITVTLQDAQLEFEPRYTPFESGSITTGGATTLIDTAATFITNLVTRGDLVINFTDGSVAAVLSVDSEIQLTTTVLRGGVGDDYEVSDTYAVYDVEQCNIDGGNLVAVDATGSILNPVFPSFGTQIVRTSSSSATFLNAAELEFASFGGGVTISESSGSTGTEFPVGTRQEPSNNVAEAHTIADTRGLIRFFLTEDMTLSSEDFSDGHIFHGDSIVFVTLTVADSANVVNSEFQNMRISGVLDGNNTVRNCIVHNLDYFNGYVEDSGLSGTITLAGGAQAQILNCHSSHPGGGTDQTPTVDLGGFGQGLVMRNYNGGIKLTNLSGANDEISIDMNSGQVVIDSSVVSGTIILRGVAKLTDNSGPGAIIDSDYLISGLSPFTASIAEAVWDIQITPEHTGSNTAGEFLFGAGGGSSPSAIADAVWNEAVADHSAAGTFGEKIGSKLLTFIKWVALKKN